MTSCAGGRRGCARAATRPRALSRTASAPASTTRFATSSVRPRARRPRRRAGRARRDLRRQSRSGATTTACRLRSPPRDRSTISTQRHRGDRDQEERQQEPRRSPGVTSVWPDSPLSAISSRSSAAGCGCWWPSEDEIDERVVGLRRQHDDATGRAARATAAAFGTRQRPRPVPRLRRTPTTISAASRNVPR